MMKMATKADTLIIAFSFVSKDVSKFIEEITLIIKSFTGILKPANSHNDMLQKFSENISTHLLLSGSDFRLIPSDAVSPYLRALRQSIKFVWIHHDSSFLQKM